MRVLPMKNPATKWEIGRPKKTKDNRFFFHLKDGGSDHELVYQLSKVYLGSRLVQETEDGNVPVRRIDMEVSDEFLPTQAFFEAVDRHAIRTVKDRRDTMFPGKQFTDRQIETRFVRSPTTDPSGRTCVSCRVSPSLAIFAEDKTPLEPAAVSIEHPVDVIVKLVGIWFTKHKFGLSWEIVQVRARKLEEKQIQGYNFLDESEEEENDEDFIDFFPDEE